MPSMPRGEDDSSIHSPVVIDRLHAGPNGSMSIDDIRPTTLKIDIPTSSLGYPEHIPRSSPSRRQSMRPPSVRNPSSPATPTSVDRRSKLATPLFTSLREKDDPYFLALPDSSRSKILSNSVPDLNTLPHPPPRAHRRHQRDSVANGNGRLMEQLHSSRRHSVLVIASQSSTDPSPVSRRSTIKTPFRLQPRSRNSSGSSSPNYLSDSESEIFDDDHSNVGSVASTRPSSFGSTASFGETFLRASASTSNLNGKLWNRASLTPSFSALDLMKKRETIILPELDTLETEDCRFLESEYHRFISLNPVQQGSTLRRNLLPVFARPALSPPAPSFPLLARKCAILLKFQSSLLAGLAPRSTLPQAERNTFLEAVASICERREWREYARGMYDETNFSDENSEGSVLSGMIAAMERFREHERMSYHCVSIAMEYLGRKNFSGSAVEYCGRVLAVAFFYSPGVAVRLIHALNVATPFTARLLDEVCEDGGFRDLSAQTPFLRPLFPKHLHDVIYSTPQRYNALLMTRPSPTVTIDSNLTISFAGEWVHRWRAHNSDVFFSFLKHWHVILSEHLQASSSELSVATIAAAPGYLVMQGHILRMVDSFIHRSSNELPVHPLPAPHHKSLSQSTLCKRAFERHPNGPLGPPMPVHLQQGNRMQDSIHAMALLMNSGDGRPQGIEKAEKKIAKAVSAVLSAVRKTQSSKPIIPIRPGLLGGESDDTLPSGSRTATSSERDVSSTPRTVSTSDISSLVSSSNKSYSSSDRRTSLPSLQFQQHLVSLFAVLFERTLKAAVRKTSVWEGQACFALCDVIERLIPVIDDSLTKAQDTLTSLDWPFWTDVVKRLMLTSENSVTQVRAFGFLFNIWERCPSGGDWLLNEDIWETFFCHWSTLVRCYFMNLVCWRVCMSGQGGVSVDPYFPINEYANIRSTILLLKKRLEIAQMRNVVLIRYAQANNLPIPVLKASNPLPNRRLVVVATNPSVHEYGITFDSIVPASPASPPVIEKQVIEILKPQSQGSEVATVLSSDASVISAKEEKKGFRLNIFKGVFGKSSKSKKHETKPETKSSLAPPAVITPAKSMENLKRPPITLTRSESSPHLRRQALARPSCKPESFQFSMQPVQFRLDSNKGVKERPVPSSKTIEKYVNPSAVPLPRYARDLIRSHPATDFPLEDSDHSRWRYAGRALAEWDAIVKQCDIYIDTLLRRREAIPEEPEEDTVYLKGSIENLHIPRMTVELPKFYFTGKL